MDKSLTLNIISLFFLFVTSQIGAWRVNPGIFCNWPDSLFTEPDFRLTGKSVGPLDEPDVPWTGKPLGPLNPSYNTPI